MKNQGSKNASRRAFLQHAAALSVAGVATPWALNLAAIGEAAAATAADYKALVCVFLYGGNDYGNTVIPYDQGSYTLYQNLRPALAYARASLANTVLVPSVVPRDAGGYARKDGVVEGAWACAAAGFGEVHTAGGTDGELRARCSSEAQPCTSRDHHMVPESIQVHLGVLFCPVAPSSSSA